MCSVTDSPAQGGVLSEYGTLQYRRNAEESLNTKESAKLLAKIVASYHVNTLSSADVKIAFIENLKKNIALAMTQPA